MTDRQTDGRTELPWLIQRSALQAMRPSCKNEKYDLSNPLRELRVTYALHLSIQLVGKRVVDFLFATIALFFASSYG